MKQAIRFTIALGLLVVMGAGVAVMAITAAISAIAWLVGQ